MATTTSGQLTIKSGGQTYIATPTATTAAQREAGLAAGWKPVTVGQTYTPTGKSIQGGQPLTSVDTSIKAPEITTTKEPYLPPQTQVNTPINTGQVVAPGAVTMEKTNDQAMADQSAARIKSLLGLDVGQKPEDVSAVDIKNKVDMETGIRQKEAQVQSLVNQMNMITQNAQARIIATQGQGRGIPEDILGGQQAQIQREAAIQSLQIAPLLSAAQGDLDSARTHADALFNLYYKDATNKVDQWWKTAGLYMNEFSNIEQQQIASKKSELDFQRQTYRDQMDNASTIAKGLLSTNPTAAAQIMKLTPPAFGDAEAMQTYQEDVNRIVGTSGGTSLDPQYAGIIDSVSTLVPATSRAAFKSAVSNAINSGNYTNAYSNIANAVENSLQGSNKTKFQDTKADIQVMSGMRQAILDYTNAGGDIGFLKGTADDLAKKFGQLAVDPKFAALGVQLQREFQQYRLAMTGAAFSPAESKEYAAVNPRTNATLNLNLATIDGALAQLTNRYVGTINASVPDAKLIYDKMIGKETASSTSSPSGMSIDDAYNAYLGVTSPATTASTTTPSTSTTVSGVRQYEWDSPLKRWFK